MTIAQSSLKNAKKRQIILDTETTGLDPLNHRIIEIGCIELENRRFTGSSFHRYLNPERVIDAGAFAVHGLSSEFLADKPLFKDIAEELLVYLQGAELIIHNAPFDVGFLEREFVFLNKGFGKLTDYCDVLDTLPLARRLHPSQRNSLDALCKRYNVDNSQRQLHGALKDAQLLGEVYLRMTGGQMQFKRSPIHQETGIDNSGNFLSENASDVLVVVYANEEEKTAHEAYMEWLKTV